MHALQGSSRVRGLAVWPGLSISSVLTVLVMLGCIASVSTAWAGDLTEGNAADWSSFTPIWEGVTSSVSDATSYVRAGD